MYWGYSSAFDLQKSIIANTDTEPINILILNSSDARHVLKTVSSLHLHKSNREIIFHVVENTLDEIARSILLLSICFEEGLGLQEATRYYLEILGNTLLRPATAKFVISRSNALTDVITDSKKCDWLDITQLKYKHRDALEHLYKFWALGASENISTSKLWDLRLRRSLGTRYDYKQGAFDWDYHMILKSREIKYLTAHDYTFWRESGVAFVWIEGEPIRGNPTFVTLNENFQPIFLGDVKNGPFFTWMDDSSESNKNIRMSDVVEKQIMSAIYETHKKEFMSEEKFAAHRDSSLVNGIIVMKLDDQNSEQESWTKINKLKERKADLKWISLPNIQVKFYEMTTFITKVSDKCKAKFDCIWIGQKIQKKDRNIYHLLKESGILFSETRQFLVDYKDDEVKMFENELKNDATENGFKEVEGLHNCRAVLTFKK